MNAFGETPLHIAAIVNDTDVVKMLLGRGADIARGDMKCRTPLYWAVLIGHEEAVKILLERGADPRKENVMGLTPIDEDAKPEIVQMLNNALKRFPN